MHRNNHNNSDHKYTFTYVYDHHVTALCCLHRMCGFWQVRLASMHMRHDADVTYEPQGSITCHLYRTLPTTVITISGCCQVR